MLVVDLSLLLTATSTNLPACRFVVANDFELLLDDPRVDEVLTTSTSEDDRREEGALTEDDA